MNAAKEGKRRFEKPEGIRLKWLILLFVYCFLLGSLTLHRVFLLPFEKSSSEGFPNKDLKFSESNARKIIRGLTEIGLSWAFNSTVLHLKKSEREHSFRLSKGVAGTIQELESIAYLTAELNSLKENNQNPHITTFGEFTLLFCIMMVHSSSDTHPIPFLSRHRPGNSKWISLCWTFRHSHL